MQTKEFEKQLHDLCYVGVFLSHLQIDIKQNIYLIAFYETSVRRAHKCLIVESSIMLAITTKMA